MLLMMLAIFAIMWFFMIRPQQKKQKEIRNFQNALTEGAKVVTSGGLYGTVKRIDIEKGRVDLEIARGVVIEVDKSSIYADTSVMNVVQNKCKYHHQAYAGTSSSGSRARSF